MGLRELLTICRSQRTQSVWAWGKGMIVSRQGAKLAKVVWGLGISMSNVLHTILHAPLRAFAPLRETTHARTQNPFAPLRLCVNHHTRPTHPLASFAPLREIILAILLSLFTNTTQAQVYPVNGSAALIPPYSVYLSDYTSRSTDRLMLNVVLNDINRPELRVRLRLRIESQNVRIETKPEYIGSEIILQGGVPLQLKGIDLAEYFNANNLNFSGITRREFEKTGALPQGFYNFCFEVLEYNRGVKISNTICAPGWLILNDPPMVNLPRMDEKVIPTSPQNVVIQWTPRHTGSPNAAFSTEYEITMVEVWPASRNANDAILTSPPILETTTRSTTFIFGPAETPLELGRRYALRIKAKSIVGAEEYDLFKNNGYSEVVSFIYGDACNAPANIQVETAATKFKIMWDGQLNHSAYTFRYRPAGSTNWYTSNTNINEVNIYSLTPNTTYEYQVSGVCGFFDGQYTQVATLKTNDTGEAAYSCGLPIEAFNLDPNELTGSLKVGDVINAGDFKVKLTKVSGSNGVFSGEGVIEVSFFNKASVKAEFTNISVNKELRMVSGYMNVTGAGVEVVPSGVMDLMDDLSETLKQFDSVLNDIESNIPQPFDPNSFVADSLITIKEGIYDVYTDTDGTVVVVSKSGTETRLPAGETYAIKDDNGKGYIVDAKGKVHETTAAVAAKAGNREYNLKLKFAEDALAKFGFDEKRYDGLAEKYEKLEDKYFVSWKSVATGVTDPVIAKLDDPAIDNSKIRFELFGQPVAAAPFVSSQASVTVTGKTDGVIEDLIALYSSGNSEDKEQLLGKVKVITYDKIKKNLKIVPVNDNTFPGTAEQLTQALNKIYGQAAVEWSVTIEAKHTVTLNSTFDVGSSGLLSNYTTDMKTVINAYADEMTDETFYLFLVSKPSDGKLLGYMPRSKNAGFIFTDTNGGFSKITQTIAHELGHGAFNLQHTFEEHTALTKGSTDNLMDYAEGTKLFKYQWDHIHHPAIVIGLFESDTAGASYFAGSIPDLWRNGDKTVNFLTPGKKIIRLPKETFRAYFAFGIGDVPSLPLLPTGVLTQFLAIEDFDTVKYVVHFDGNVFKGYINEKGKYARVLPIDPTLETAVVQLPVTNGFKVYRLKELKAGYQLSDQTSDEMLDLTKPESAKLDAIWSELTTYAFDKGQVKYGVSSTLINPDYTDLFNKMDNTSVDEQYLLIAKIMEYRMVYPDLFEKMTRSFNNWSSLNIIGSVMANWITATPDEIAKYILLDEKGYKDNGYFDYLCIKNSWSSKTKEELLSLFLQEFRNLIDYHHAIYDSKIAIVRSTYNCEITEDVVSGELTANDLVNVISTLSVDELKALCPKARARFVEIILTKFIVSNPYEHAIYKLLWTSPEGSYRATLLEELASVTDSNGNFILGKLVSAVDDQTMFIGENYNTMIMNFIIRAYGELIKSSSSFATSNIKPITELDLLKVSGKSQEELEALSNRIVTYYYQGFTKRLFKEVLHSLCVTCSFLRYTDNDLLSEASFDGKTNKVFFTNKTVSGFISLAESPHISYHPLDPIILDDKAKLVDIYENSGGYYVPAITLFFIEKKGESKTTTEAIQTTLDLASLAIPGGQTTLALKILNYADKISAVASVAGSYAEADYPAFSNFMNITSGVLGLANLGVGITYSKFKNVKEMKSAMALMAHSEDAISAASHERKLVELCGKIDNINDPAKIDPNLAAIINSSSNEKKLLIDVLEIEKSMAQAAGKTDLVSKVEVAIKRLLDIKKMKAIVGAYDYITKTLSLKASDMVNIVDDLPASGITSSETYVVKKLNVDGVDYDFPANATMYEETSGTVKCYIDNGYCFPAGTNIMTAHKKQVPIETIKAGDEVVSYNHNTKTTVVNKVKSVLKRTANRLSRVLLAGGTFLLATPEHPLYANNQYVQAQHVHTGDSLLTAENKYLRVESVTTWDTTSVVYNFEVEQDQNYYVGQHHILVHNSCGWRTIKEAVEANLFKSFHNSVISAGLNAVERKNLYNAIANLSDAKVNFLEDFASDVSLIKVFGKNTELVDSWKVVEDAPEAVRKNTSVLENISSLSAKKLSNGNALDVQKLFDNGLSNTLSKVSDADKSRILSRINEWDASKVDDLARRLGDNKYSGLRDELADPDFFKLYDDIIHDPENAIDIAKQGGDALLDKVGRSTFFREITDLGRKFESKILNDLLDKSSAAYKRLNELVPDLADRKVLSQVQFCVPGKTAPCNAKGEYFIADAVFVKYDSRGRIVDMVVTDSKLSQATNLTSGQTLAKNGVGNSLVVRSLEISQDVNKVDLPSPLSSGTSVQNSAFFKIFGDGNGNFSGIN